MGLPWVLPLPHFFAPVFANLLMGHHEKIWLDRYFSSQVLFYRGYVDDTLCLFHTENDAVFFFDYINTSHSRWKGQKELPFLDTMLDNGHSSLITTVFRERTFTGPLTNYFSFAPLAYKLGLVRTLVDRGRFPFDQKFRCEFPEISMGEWYRLFQCGK